jgi:hypothetical protein
MAESHIGLRRFLAIPSDYEVFQTLVGANKARPHFVGEHVRA